MEINLSANDIRILKDALDCWERDESMKAMTAAVVGAVFTPREERDEMRRQLRSEMTAAENVTKQRRDQATLIRAALIRAEAVAQEHADSRD